MTVEQEKVVEGVFKDVLEDALIGHVRGRENVLAAGGCRGGTALTV